MTASTNIKRDIPPVHPGEILKLEFLEEYDRLATSSELPKLPTQQNGSPR